MKDAIATVSYRCAVSIPKARIAFQTVCDKMYGHRYYLTSEEQEEFEPSVTLINNEQRKSKKPRTADDYARYKNVLPSPRMVAEYKHNKALHQEIAAAKALENLEEGTKVTLHYDTTGRSRVDGEWPSLL